MKKISKNTIKLLLLLVLALVFSCSIKPEISKAKSIVETLIHEIDKENYSGLSEYYTPEFNEGESEEVRANKFKRLKDAMGSIESIEFVDSKSENLEEYAISLTYKIKRTKINSVETFIVVNEEGEYKVARHNVTNENL